MNKALKNELLKIEQYFTMKKDNNGVTDIILTTNTVELKFSNSIKFITDKRITQEFIRKLTDYIAVETNESFSTSQPILLSTIPDTNHRFTAIHSDITGNKEHSIVIRVHRKQNKDITLEDFTTNIVDMQLIKKVVTDGGNIMISGATGSGKTTFLNVITSYFPDERVITIENSLEIQIPEHIRSKQSLIKNNNVLSNTTYASLINASMRLNPKRMIIGEIDIENAQTFLKVINTGHKGIYTTIHANSAYESVLAISNNLNISNHSMNIKDLFHLIQNDISLIIQIENQKILEIKKAKDLRYILS